MRVTQLALAISIPLGSACIIGDPSQSSSSSEPPVGPGEQRVRDDVVGASVVVPDTWTMSRDPVLFDTHGFYVHDAEGNHHDPVAHIALAYTARPGDLEALVAEKLEKYPGATRQDVALPDGRTGIAVTGMPGTSSYSVVFTVDGGRVYEIGLWSAEPGIDERGHALLQQVRFRAPSQDIETLGLAGADDALFGAPPPDVEERNADANERRRLLALRAAEHDPQFAAAMHREIFEPPVPAGTSAAPGCGFRAPESLYWQLQWDETNTFYSGTYYNLRARSGWSAMSGNYGSWWGTNYHVGLCYTDYSNQYYANDWPAQHWANAYAAFSGRVEWAGWGTDGFKTLGRYVVVRNGLYRNTTAHLSGIRAGVTWGAWINGYWDTIGWAGDTGGPWDPHLHARVTWGESLTWNGQPYGGQSVRPDSFRCFDCVDYDVAAAGAGGYYTQFWHGRWMRY